MQHGYTSATAAGLVIGAGVLTLGSNKFGVSRGGFTFDPAREITNIDFDGKTSDLVGLDMITRYAPVFTGVLQEVTNANLTRLEANVAFAGSVLTPKPAMTLLQTADYLQDLRIVLDTGDGQFHRVHFPYALCTSYSIRTQHANSAEIQCTFMAKLLPTGNPPDINAAPYKHERAATPP